MPVEEFIIAVFCWVETALADVTGGVKLRTRGLAPRLSDSEVITMEIVGELLGQEGDEAIWEYFQRHWVGWFPGLGDRSTLVRQAANLWRVKPRLQERWVADLGARTADGHIMDGFPIAVCQLARAPRSKVLKAEADYGYCAAKDEYYYGLKANLLIDRRGVVVGRLPRLTWMNGIRRTISCRRSRDWGTRVTFAPHSKPIVKPWALICKRPCARTCKSTDRAGG
jgi:hypothetical protein